MSFIKDNLLGFLFSAIVAVVALLLAPNVPKVNGIILAFLLAVMLGNVLHLPKQSKAGIKFSSSTLLEIAIIFLAFSINFKNIADLGLSTFIYIVFIVLGILLLTLFLVKKFYNGNSTMLLVGFGTAICGSSAIAAAAPIIAKENKDGVGISIAVVNLLGSIGMLFLPFFLSFIIDNPLDLGFLLGGTLQSVGNVAGAGYAVSDTVGEAAITVKLARVALLSPAVILFGFLANRNQIDSSQRTGSFTLPYYLWLFIGITVLNSLVAIPDTWLNVLKQVGEVVLAISMAAIGLKVSFKTLWISGKKAIGFGLLIFVVQILIALALVVVF